MNLNDPAWQGHYQLSAPLDVTVDLGSSQALGLIRSYYYEDLAAGPLVKPTTVEILTSPGQFDYQRRQHPASAAVHHREAVAL